MTLTQTDIEKIILEILAENNPSLDYRLGQFEYYFSEEVFKRVKSLNSDINNYQFRNLYIPALINLASNNLISFRENLIANFNFSNVKIYLTDYGEKYVQDPDVSPYDGEGYIDYLKQNIPTIDDIVESYLKESLNTFKTKCYLSSVFTLGAASERLILLLRDEYCDALSSNYPQRKARIEKEYQIKKIYESIHCDFEKLGKNYFGFDFWETIDSEVRHIFDLIRRSRNETGHPKKISGIDKFYAHGNLVIFPRYCITVYKLVDHLKNNSLPVGVSL